jgi:putative transposase
MNWKQLLASITGSVDEELRLRNACLMAENRILRTQIKGRVQLTDAERKTLAEMGQKLGKKALEEIATVAKPDTILAWHRTLVVQPSGTSQPRKALGRPRIDQELEALVVRMARENRSWGYDRIVGAVANLGYRISDQTVGNILKRHDIPPAPERTKTLTWWEFIRMHMAVLGATEFFSSAAWSWLRLLVSFVLSFLHVGLRKGYGAGMTFLCHGGWIWPLFLWSPDEQRDAERWVCLVGAEAPSRWMLCGEWVVQPIFCEVKTPDDRAPLPQGVGRVVLMPAANRHQIRDGPFRCQQRFSGLLRNDTREAA